MNDLLNLINRGFSLLVIDTRKRSENITASYAAKKSIEDLEKELKNKGENDTEELQRAKEEEAKKIEAKKEKDRKKQI